MTEVQQDFPCKDRNETVNHEQCDIVGTSSQSGLADTLQSFFLSLVKPTENGWIWGAGPALLFHK